MRSYESIPVLNEKNLAEFQSIEDTFFAYEKLDGSNVRVEFDLKKLKFEKWGSRTQLISTQNGETALTRASSIFHDTFPIDALVEHLKALPAASKNTKFTAFFELLGPSSFAGSHSLDEQQKLYLLDVWQEKIGEVRVFNLYKEESLRDFLPKKLDMIEPRFVDQSFLDAVRSGDSGIFDHSMPPEGIILRSWATQKIDGAYRHHKYKLKQSSWIEKVKATHANWEKII